MVSATQLRSLSYLFLSISLIACSISTYLLSTEQAVIQPAQPTFSTPDPAPPFSLSESERKKYLDALQRDFASHELSIEYRPPRGGTPPGSTSHNILELDFKALHEEVFLELLQEQLARLGPGSQLQRCTLSRAHSLGLNAQCHIIWPAQPFAEP